MLMLTRGFVKPFLDRYRYGSYVDIADLPGRRPRTLQPKVSWQHRNGVFLLLQLLRDLQQHELHLAQEQESCHTA